jgi:hypothetical protein
MSTVVNYETAKEQWGRDRIRRYLTIFVKGEPAWEARCAEVVILATAMQCGFDMADTKRVIAEAKDYIAEKQRKAEAEAAAAAGNEGGPAA